MGDGHLTDHTRTPVLHWLDFFLREVNNLYKRKTLNISFFRVEVEMQGLDYGCALDYTPQPSLFFYDEQ